MINTLYSQTANFKTCTEAHFATSRGYVACGGRIEGQFCEYDHFQEVSCVHGLSQDLCSGPNHYPADNPYDDYR